MLQAAARSHCRGLARQRLHCPAQPRLCLRARWRHCRLDIHALQRSRRRHSVLNISIEPWRARHHSGLGRRRLRRDVLRHHYLDAAANAGGLLVLPGRRPALPAGLHQRQRLRALNRHWQLLVDELRHTLPIWQLHAPVHPCLRVLLCASVPVHARGQPGLHIVRCGHVPSLLGEHWRVDHEPGPLLLRGRLSELPAGLQQLGAEL